MRAVGIRIPSFAADYLLSTHALEIVLRSAETQPGTVFQRFLKAFSVTVTCPAADRSLIPTTGPAIIVANHPYGLLDGLALGAMLDEVRPDTKLLANSLLMSIPELSDRLIPLNPFGGRLSGVVNVRGIRQAVDWLKAGHALAVFPAGEVSRFHLDTLRVTDGPWSELVTYLSKRSSARVIPMRIDGRNRILFQCLSFIHPALGTALLPREALSKRTPLSIRVGRPISTKTLASFSDNATANTYVRLRTDLLGAPRYSATTLASQHPLIEAVDPELLVRDISALPNGARLLVQGSFEVFATTSEHIPAVLTEIGRLRELSFRAVGEGTGLGADRDSFDQHYIHLFLWKSDTKEIVGAYRLGSTESIIATHGPSGVYSTTLFKFSQAWWRETGPALELGRSFIRPEYQGEYNPLRLLWKGIGVFLEHHPHRFLFGPVSISARYSNAARELMAETLASHSSLAGHVHPRHTMRPGALDQIEHARPDLSSLALADVDDIVFDIQGQQSGLPVLLRQYLGLGGAVLQFNVDPMFSDALDGLLIIDILNGNTRRLRAYLGEAALGAIERAHASGVRAA